MFFRLAAVLALTFPCVSNAASPEENYLASRDAAIAKFAKQAKAGKVDDALDKAEAAARDGLKAQLSKILSESPRAGFAPAEINLDTLYEGEMGFGLLDGLRFDAETGISGAKVGQAADGSYVEPKAHIIVTTESLFTRWLRGHKEWWDKDAKNVPQQVEAALKFESLYTQAISTDAAVINFHDLPISKPASASVAYGFLAGRTQDTTPDKADEVFVAALADGKMYVAYSDIAPAVEVPACATIRTDFEKKADAADEKLKKKQITRKAYDQLGDLRERGDGAFKKCFVQQVAQQPAFVEATKQAQALLETAIGK